MQLPLFSPCFESLEQEKAFLASLPHDLSPEEQFQKYHHENPQVYKAFCKEAEYLWTIGYRQYGAKTIMEFLRRHTTVKGNDGLKINNNYTSHCARKLISEQPKFRDFFKLRELKS